MAAFTHLNSRGSRFSDGTFGVFHAGDTLETAIAGTVFHLTRYLLESDEPSQDLDMRVVLADLDAQLWDVRGPEFAHLRDPDPATHGAGQALGRQAKLAGADGILFRSARKPSGECAATRQSQHLVYPWNGRTIDSSRICVKTLL